MNMKQKHKKVYGHKNFKIQHVYLIFKYRTKISKNTAYANGYPYFIQQ